MGWDRQLFGGLEGSEAGKMLGRCTGTFSFMKIAVAWAVNIGFGGDCKSCELAQWILLCKSKRRLYQFTSPGLWHGNTSWRRLVMPKVGEGQA